MLNSIQISGVRVFFPPSGLFGDNQRLSLVFNTAESFSPSERCVFFFKRVVTICLCSLLLFLFFLSFFVSVSITRSVCSSSTLISQRLYTWDRGIKTQGVIGGRLKSAYTMKCIVLSQRLRNNKGRVRRGRGMETDTESDGEGWGENRSNMQPCVILRSQMGITPYKDFFLQSFTPNYP